MCVVFLMVLLGLVCNLIMIRGGFLENMLKKENGVVLIRFFGEIVEISVIGCGIMRFVSNLYCCGLL